MYLPSSHIQTEINARAYVNSPWCQSILWINNRNHEQRFSQAGISLAATMSLLNYVGRVSIPIAFSKFPISYEKKLGSKFHLCVSS